MPGCDWHGCPQCSTFASGAKARLGRVVLLGVGEHEELKPQEARYLAQQLLDAADEAEADTLELNVPVGVTVTVTTSSGEPTTIAVQPGILTLRPESP